MAELVPKRIKDGDAVPTIPSTLVLPCDDTTFSKGYKITIQQLSGYGLATIDCTWNLRSSWYSPPISLPFDSSAFIGFDSMAFFDDDGNSYMLHSIYDQPLQNYDYREQTDDYKKRIELPSTSGFEVQVKFLKSQNVIQAQYFYPWMGTNHALTDFYGLFEAVSGTWGARYNDIPDNSLHSGCLSKFKLTNTGIPRMRLVIRYSVPLDEA